MLQSPHLREKLFREDADVGLRDSRGREYIDNLTIRGNRLGDELSHRCVDLVRRPAVAGILFVERRLNRLNEGNVVPDLGCLITGSTQGKRSRQLHHHLHKAPLAVVLFEHVLLARWNECELFPGTP